MRRPRSVDVLSSQFPQVVLGVTRALAEGNLEIAYQRWPTVAVSRHVLAHQAGKLLVLRDHTSGWADLGSRDRTLATVARNGTFHTVKTSTLKLALK